jgi:two-component system, chemotaxis family, CheB/CheR fusion protein
VTDQETDKDFEALLEFLRDSRGFDFTGYKRSSLMRRTTKRMQDIGIETFAEYLDRLQVDQDEFTQLFNHILINVTAFFRDEQIWQFVAAEVIPQIVASKGPQQPIRAWDAGCASGEESYTIAILLAEALGWEDFQRRVKIYATDVDEEALEQARTGTYTAKQAAGVSPELLEKYFRQNGSSYVFDKDLRRSVIFGRHDLVKNAPISRIDLMICRNTLMYLNADLQSKILSDFRFALNPDGFMVLGKAEMLFTRSQSFVPMDLRRRVFRPAPQPEGGAQQGPADPPALVPAADEEGQREAVFYASPVAQIVFDASGRLTLVNRRAQEILQLGANDIGRSVQDLDVSFRSLDLRTGVERVREERQPIVIPNLDWRSNGERLRLEVEFLPLVGQNDSWLGATVALKDVTSMANLEEDLHTSTQELQTAMEELQSTNEELETTNEELQSTNEELETTNEELQSTNEELETMNEELQSTNEELEAVNEEARQQATDLNQSNVLLESILRTLNSGVIVVGQDLHVRAWNEGSQELWGLRPNEVIGQSFPALDIGLPVDRLLEPIKKCLGGSDRELLQVDAVNRRGQAIRCRVTCTPLRNAEGEIDGVIFLTEPLEP